MSPRLPIGVATICSPGASRATVDGLAAEQVAPWRRVRRRTADCAVYRSLVVTLAVAALWRHAAADSYPFHLVNHSPPICPIGVAYADARGVAGRTAVSAELQVQGVGRLCRRGAARLRACSPRRARSWRAAPAIRNICRRHRRRRVRRRRRARPSAPARSKPASSCRCRRPAMPASPARRCAMPPRWRSPNSTIPTSSFWSKTTAAPPRRRSLPRSRRSTRAPRSFSARCLRNRSASSARWRGRAMCRSLRFRPTPMSRRTASIC